jgi:glycosyltransferase involved in cell wall biosynthesis
LPDWETQHETGNEQLKLRLRRSMRGHWNLRHETRGRAAAINRGVQEATAPIICVLHADTLLPDDAVAVMRRVLADPGTALAGFTPLLSGPDQVRWGTSFHNWIKTWYAPLLFRPQLFLRGVRLLFGDHAMFFHRADFLTVGGCDPTLLVMEEADLCIRFHRLGRTCLVNRVVITSDRGVKLCGRSPISASLGGGPRVRIHFPPARRQQRTLWLPGASHAGGTQSSNPLCSSGESGANSTPRFGDQRSVSLERRGP